MRRNRAERRGFAVGRRAHRVALAAVLEELSTAVVEYRGQIAPRVHLFVTERALSRVRSYQTAGMNPIAARGRPVETLLLVHVHEDAAGGVVAIEGFNGAEGERAATRLRDELGARGLLPPDATFRPSVPLRDCAHSQRPIPPKR